MTDRTPTATAPARPPRRALVRRSALAPTPTARSAPPSTLAARGLTRTYGETVALGGVAIDLRPGEAVAVTGASGSGKSTLLHCLSGVTEPESGSVVLDDPRHGRVDLAGLDAEQRAAVRLRSFGFVFQQGLLLPELTAAENVALPLMLAGTARAAATARASAGLAALGLDGLGDRRLGQLSGGQQQRVAIARAQVGDPVVVFADEPTGALDSRTSAEVMSALLASTRDRGRTLVVVTHDGDVAASCDRVVHLVDGRVVPEGRGR